VMGIINITPDSFSDGTGVVSIAEAVEKGKRMVTEGAAILDVGGESTRPGSASVPLDEELRRVVPLVKALAGEVPVPISVDTTKPEVMVAAVAAGAGLINDILALQAPGALETAAGLGVPVCVMHMQGSPRTMQQDPQYGDVVAEVRDFLHARAEACIEAGIAPERVILDPGFGFGKALGHNCRLLRELPSLTALGYPVLVGLSRKSMLGQLVERPVDQRVSASVAAATLAVWLGARIVRVHDVPATVDAITVVEAVGRIG
jgi:dihydropteroate synthase